VTWHERLSGLDALFLQIEDRTAHMHVGAVFVYEGSLPAYRDLVSLIASRIERLPRYRQRLAFVPLNLDRPSWVDESHLDLEYHVRHTALPQPGGDEPLKRLAARLFSQRLDRDKPLWELWLVEGLGGGRFATISKTHHCMLDGLAGVELTMVLHDAEPGRTEPPAARPWTPRPAPDRAALAAAAVREQLTHPLRLAREAFDSSTRGRRMLLELVGGLKPLVGISLMGRAPESSLNQPIGPHRRWEMASIDLAAVKRVRKALGGTVNDVILAVVAGGVRKLLEARGESPSADLRALVPVNVRAPGERGPAHGNQVAAVFCPLPVGEPDAVERLRKVIGATQELKGSGQAVGALALTHLRELTPATLATLATRLDVVTRWFNLVVTNVPGPQTPLYLLGRKLVACYPQVPLARAQTMAIAVLSYHGAIGIGLLGDADKARDLPVLARAIPEALEELVARARPESPSPLTGERAG
jgi:diacylglycerol O-acyltransferase